MSTLDVHDELQGLEPWQRRLFACSLVERNIYPLQHYTPHAGRATKIGSPVKCWTSVGQLF